MIYPYIVFKAKEGSHIFWVAKSTELKGCIGQGDTPEEATDELKTNEIAWIETAKEVGIEIPEVQIEPQTEYSGQVTLHFSPSEHRKAVLIAKREGISLNQYISDAVVSKNGELSDLAH